jgi:hypothetical protein
MDILNAFFLFNIVASITILIGFFSMRESVNAGFNAAKARVSSAQLGGVAGAATSMAILASVAHLFQ